MLRKIFFTLTFFTLFVSCETDFEVHAEWEDHTIIYSVLDPTDSIHYTKVYKAFLGPENAFEMAQEVDSIYYNPESISVVLIDLQTNESIVLRDTVLDPIEEGVFATHPNRLYYYEGTIHDDRRYQIEVRKSHETTWAQSKILDAGPVDNNLSSVFKFYNNLTNNYHTPRRVTVPALTNGYYYEVDLQFHYKEWDWNNPSDTSMNMVNWRIGSEANPHSEMDFWIESEEFFQKLKTRIPVDASVQRLFDRIVITYSIAERELYNYISINDQASQSLLFELPTYTNIQEGSGIFSSRRYEEVTKSIDGDTRARLVVDPHTEALNFINP